MQTVKLNNEVTMPQLGLGVFQVWDPAETQQTVETALELGYRLIDTAAAYHNETAVGAALAASKVPREELFVTSKLWVQDMTYAGAQRGVRDSLAKLGLDYLDLYLIHQPIGDVYGAWRALEELYEAGKIRAIGVSNFSPALLAAFTHFNRIKPAVNQIPINVFQPQTAPVDYLQANGIQPEAWGPFAEGRHDLFTNEVLTKIGQRYHKTPAQVAIRWLIQRGVVVIPKSTHEQRLQENLEVFDFELLPADMVAITELEMPQNHVRTAADVERILQITVHED
ncbi:aldo/keto reductase [Levilactobacillus brevis]|jgi:2,5-diketo-D-gluconate reductase A|uniref:Aldo/keto reductase of diketogulonate reductase family n=5 Tax=Levilactobacillus brevis TaxID=1580 RepID=Q03NQ8_LEVBA|nr:aldo/keto reductase [Levilactobacillus brevis]ABJ65164.1 Aldo/keto reductase of diketogulonate reductase family [Levilactobacillus brevis ATCC 367]ANN49995.1 2,5-diketo-D-gluconic acid reductase [Levilactobacillus brevis]ARN89296.1 2,5-diketo-D-gluconic acid reductase [Levilactobacillus brevis]ARN93496.1 2,5-diketo-D-gluconic acid reductase [Levilactobacillus brevis]ARN96087.1 2,5-diketo-D-gluconic acid reductase [Levilactobacillus brevis]